MTEHGALSIIADIKPGMKQTLIEALQQIETGKEDINSIIPFRKMTSIHFARFVILNERADTSGNPISAGLAFTTNFDLPLNKHLQQLVELGGKGLWQIFSFCANFPQSGYDPLKLHQYLQQYNKKAETFYVGVGNRSVQQIRNEKLLREEIEKFVDTNEAAFENKDPLFIRNKIIEHVNSKPEFSWAKTPEPEETFTKKLKHYGALVLVILVFILLLPILLPIVIFWVLIILIDEIRDNPKKNIVTKQHVRELTERETGMVQAQFSAGGNLKPGWFRLQTIVFLLKLTNFLAPYLFSKGKLSGIPTVHFARWLIINEGRQMLFLSNYDGNSESYLRDFIHIAGKQLTLLFSHTMGYPKTWLMIFGGAKDAKKFMEWARYNQMITNVWYSANKNVTVKNIFNNSKIREGLYGTLTEKEALKWLSLI